MKCYACLYKKMLILETNIELWEREEIAIERNLKSLESNPNAHSDSIKRLREKLKVIREVIVELEGRELQSAKA